jgi:hypothetical protein
VPTSPFRRIISGDLGDYFLCTITLICFAFVVTVT